MTPRPTPRCSEARNARHAPFLRLPGELRNKIYDYALFSERINWDYSSGTIATELPQVCRQIHREVRSLVFTSCTFRMTVWDLPDFLKSIGREQWRLIQSLVLCTTSNSCGDYMLKLFYGNRKDLSLEHLPNIKRVIIQTQGQIRYHPCGSPERCVMKLAEDLRSRLRHNGSQDAEVKVELHDGRCPCDDLLDLHYE